VDKQSKQDHEFFEVKPIPLMNILERARSARFRSDAVFTPLDEDSTYPVEGKYMKQFVFAVTRTTGWPGDNYPVTLEIYTDHVAARRAVDRKKKENKDDPSEPKFSVTTFEVKQ
jgi:hypothetical protein